MTDLNVMMREQARNGLQTQLDAAVTNGDTEAARKITADLEKLAVQTAPKAPPYGDTEIRAELEKAPWFGIDPKKSAKAVDFGKTMDPKKFATAALFAAALIKAVDDEFPVKTATNTNTDNEDETDEDNEDETDEENKTPARKPRKTTDGPNEADASVRATARRTSGPWVKMSDAPSEVQKEINRVADKMVSSNAPKEQRENFVKKALESHYLAHQRTKAGKK